MYIFHAVLASRLYTLLMKTGHVLQNSLQTLIVLGQCSKAIHNCILSSDSPTYIFIASLPSNDIQYCTSMYCSILQTVHYIYVVYVSDVAALLDALSGILFSLNQFQVSLVVEIHIEVHFCSDLARYKSKTACIFCIFHRDSRNFERFASFI